MRALKITLNSLKKIINVRFRLKKFLLLLFIAFLIYQNDLNKMIFKVRDWFQTSDQKKEFF